MHFDKANRNVTYFQIHQENILKTIGNLFASISYQPSDGLCASGNISLLIARSGKPHTIGEERVLPALREILYTVS